VPTLDAQIDALYALPLSEFTSARNALAKTMARPDAVLVKALQKPTSVAWAVNLLYWRDRRTFDRLRRSGQALRAAQVAALEGRGAAVDAPTSAHRDAVSDATRRATQIAAGNGPAPSTDALTRMLEAISVRPDPLDTPGRWTDTLLPAGFEALVGLSPAAVPVSNAKISPAPVAAHSAVSVMAGDRAAETARRQVAAAAHAEARAAYERAAADVVRADAWLEAARVTLARAEADSAQARAAAAVAGQTLARAEVALDATSAVADGPVAATTPAIPRAGSKSRRLR
jgi:hypothetical protein